ncbi:MAG: DUF4962 domain-containing protein [Lentisphaerae bacterium]|nr:DUF4962 domain-containing protein [Lentisphaerota bacterium]
MIHSLKTIKEAFVLKIGRGEKEFEFDDFPKPGIWRFTIYAGPGSFDTEKFFITLPPVEWRPKSYRIAPVNADFTKSNRVVLPMAACYIDGEHYHNAWFDIPSRANITAGKYRCVLALPVKKSGSIVKIKMLDPLEIREIRVEPDERQALLDKVESSWKENEPGPVHPRMFFDKTSLPVWHERCRTTHLKAWTKITHLMEKHFKCELTTKLLRHDDNGEHFDAGNYVIFYAFGAMMLNRRDYYESAWEIAEKHFINADHWPVQKDTDASFMTHYACDNDLCGIHGPAYALSLLYDWCWNYMTDERRRKTREKLAHHAEILFRQSLVSLGEQAGAYNNDHHTGVMASLAFMSAALLGEDKRALHWLQWCRAVLEKTFAYQAKDGSYHGAYLNSSWAVDIAHVVLQCELLRILTGENIFSRLPLKAATEYRLYTEDEPGNNASGRWSKDRFIRLLTARETQDPASQWLAEKLESVPLHDQVRVPAARHIWEMLFYDPSVVAKEPVLPLSRMFPEHDIFIARDKGFEHNPNKWIFEIRCKHPIPHSAFRQRNIMRAVFNRNVPSRGHFTLMIGGRVFSPSASHGYLPLTSQANCVTINGIGQLGEYEWLAPELPEKSLGRIIEHGIQTHLPVPSSDNETIDFAVFDLQQCYPSDLKIKHYLRRATVFRKNDKIARVEVEDHIKTAAPSRFCGRFHSYGAFEKINDNRWILTCDDIELFLDLSCSGAGLATECKETELVRNYIPPSKGENMTMIHLQYGNSSPTVEFRMTLSMSTGEKLNA